MKIKNTVLQNSLFSKKTPKVLSWKKYSFNKQDLSSVESKREIEKLFNDSNIQKDYFSGNYQTAYEKIIKIDNPEQHHIKMLLEIMHYKLIDFKEYLTIFDKLTEDLIPLYFYSIYQWFYNKSKSKDDVSEQSINMFFEILIKSSNLKIEKDYTEENRKHYLVKTIKYLFDNKNTNSSFIKNYEINKTKIPKIFEEKFNYIFLQNDNKLNYSKYNNFINKYLSKYDIDEDFKNKFSFLIKEILHEFDMFHKGLKDPKFSILTGLASYIRLAIEELINKRTKFDFINHLEKSSTDTDYKEYCPKRCKGFNKNICKIFSNINYANRNIHVGEWIYFIKDYIGFDPKIKCKRLELCKQFLDEKKWSSYMIHEKLAKFVEESYFDNKLSEKVHNIVCGIENYNLLYKLFFEDLIGIDYEYWQDFKSFETQKDNRSIFKLFLDPRLLNAN